MQIKPDFPIERVLIRKFIALPWPLLLLTAVFCSTGVAMLYSAANGSLDPWAFRQIIHIGAGTLIIIALISISPSFLLRYAYWIYAGCIVLLILVDVAGSMGMGARRWINIGGVTIQPSEFMKLALVVALARYYHFMNSSEIGRHLLLLPPLILIAIPVVLILRQPNLGTAVILASIGICMLFAAGIRWRLFIAAGILGIIAIPMAWMFLLHDYQKQRVMTFLNPESDPLGSGYNIMQSKIAIGSGGWFGKGFLEGSQSQLNFLPEKQTDFIFTMLAEEFGLVGGLLLIACYTILLTYGYFIGLNAKHGFSRLIAMGVCAFFFMHIFINIGMVMGMLPVVGVPLPFLSYGGTMMITALTAIGLLIVARREDKLPT